MYILETTLKWKVIFGKKAYYEIYFFQSYIYIKIKPQMKCTIACVKSIAGARNRRCSSLENIHFKMQCEIILRCDLIFEKIIFKCIMYGLFFTQ